MRGFSNHTTTISQPEGRRRSLRIIESRRKILRDTLHEIVADYKRAQRRQRWRDAIWDIIQQKRAKQQRLKRMVRKIAEQRRAQKAAEFRARIRERQEERRCVVCLSYYCPSEMHIQRLFHIRGVPEKLKFPRKVLNTTIRIWCCKARVHMACILQSIYSLCGRANKHHWRCIHCRRYLMDSRDEDIFHIGINEVDSFDSEDEEIEHVQRIDIDWGRGSIGPSHVPVCKINDTTIKMFCFLRCFICLQYDLPDVPTTLVKTSWDSYEN